jgi:hypothetical protein
LSTFFGAFNSIGCEEQGCQSHLGTTYQNGEKYMPNDHRMHQTAIKFISIPNGHKIQQHLPLQDPPKFIQKGIFGLTTDYLAPLD